MNVFTAEQFEDIQGFILSAFAHLRPASYLFLRIDDQIPRRKALEAVMEVITTSKRWPKDAKGKTIKPDQTFNLAFTYSGFEKMGLPEETLWSFTREFRLGMASRAEILGDTGQSAPENWTVGHPDQEIDVLAILGATSMEHLDALRDRIMGVIEMMGGGLAIVKEERGYRDPTEKEPFGWKDGIAQPKIQHEYGGDISKPNVIPTGEIILGYPNGYDIYPPSPGVLAENDPEGILPPFPGGTNPDYRDFGANGSYIVYRKLHQNVATFWNYFMSQAKRLDTGQPDKDDALYLASKAVGRWPSGAPLVLAPDKDDPAIGADRERSDNFLYTESDPYGFKCPIGSHVRRSNPRDSRINENTRDSLIAINRHRIIRRATSYGDDLHPRDNIEHGDIPEHLEDDGQERGLHFFALNASIRRQFELIQVQWCNDETFNGLVDNKDPIIGDNDGEGYMTIPRPAGRRRLLNLPRFVETRGGGYFFMPSMTALRYLVSIMHEDPADVDPVETTSAD